MDEKIDGIKEGQTCWNRDCPGGCFPVAGRGTFRIGSSYRSLQLDDLIALCPDKDWDEEIH
jgi:hypothetical protein